MKLYVTGKSMEGVHMKFLPSKVRLNHLSCNCITDFVKKK